MNYVIELGAEEAGIGGAKIWKSHGFYAGWTSRSGPIIDKDSNKAHAFPTYRHAENVQQGDARLKASRIVEVS